MTLSVHLALTEHIFIITLVLRLLLGVGTYVQTDSMETAQISVFLVCLIAKLAQINLIFVHHARGQIIYLAHHVFHHVQMERMKIV